MSLSEQISRVVGGHNEALKEVIRQFGVSVPASTKADDLVDKAAALGSKYLFSNFLTSSTASLFGLSASSTPNDVLDWIGQYNTHWWSVQSSAATVAYDEVKTDYTNGTGWLSVRIYDPSYSNLKSITYATSITINQTNGAISLKSPTTITPTQSANGLKSACQTLIGKYVLVDGSVYFIPTNATIGSYIASGKTISYEYDSESIVIAGENTATIKVQKVTSQIRNVPAGELTYVHSTNRNAYPDSGVQSGKTYNYLGVPFTKATTAPKIATGTYVGTGQYDAENPTTLTLDFTPKMVIIQGPHPRFFTPNLSTAFDWALLLNGITSTYVGTNTTTFKVVWGTNTVSWYSSYSASDQLNTTGVTYHYFAIG